MVPKKLILGFDRDEGRARGWGGGGGGGGLVRTVYGKSETLVII